jgi:hypothetical protein
LGLPGNHAQDPRRPAASLGRADLVIDRAEPDYSGSDYPMFSKPMSAAEVIAESS